MPVNSRLSIAVPTYNRAGILDFFLEIYVPLMRKHSIAIYISNNASEDNTIEIIEKWKKEYPYIFYSSFEETVHVDYNIEKVLRLSDAEYTWIVGDGYEIPEKSLNYILSVLPDEGDHYEFIVANLVGRIKDIEEQIYSEPNSTLEDLGWMVACLGCTIFHKSTIDNAPFAKYRNTEFLHVGIVFDYISNHDFKLLWAPDVVVVTLKSPQIKTGWGIYYFLNIFEKWPEFVSILPDTFSASSKKMATRALQEKSNLLGWRYLLTIRWQGVLNRETYIIYKDKVSDVAPGYIRSYLFILTYTPKVVCGIVRRVVEWFRRKNYQIRKALNPDLIM